MRKTKRSIERALKASVTDMTPNEPDELLSRARLIPDSPETVRSTRRVSILRPILTVAAALVLIVGAIGIYTRKGNSGAVAATVAIDVNPSIFLELDKTGKVISSTALNHDAEPILQDLELPGHMLEEAVDTLVTALIDHGYLTELSNSLLVTVESTDQISAEQLQSRLSDNIGGLLEERKLPACVMAQTLGSDAEIAQLASENHLSNGKAQLISAVVTANPRYTFEQLRTMSVNELRLLADSQNIPLDHVISTGSASDKAYIGVQRAVEIALAHAQTTQSAVSSLHTEFDYDDGRMTYEVEFYLSVSGQLREYEYEIDALTGAILDFEAEVSVNDPVSDASSAAPGVSLTREQALRIALDHIKAAVSDARKLEIELDTDHGRLLYEIEFTLNVNGTPVEYSYEIDANSGEILKKETDRHDN